MRFLPRAARIFMPALVLLAAGEWAARMLDRATPDERAVLDRFVATVADSDCLPAWTSAISETPRDRRWVEASEAEALRIEAAARRAVMPGSSLRTDRGWIVPILGSVVSAVKCAHPIRVGRPVFSGEFAFVTAATDEGVSMSAFRRRPDGWAWASTAWDGAAIIQY